MAQIEFELIFRRYFNYLRTSRDIKLEIMAKDLNIPAIYISQWENNKKNLSDAMFQSICEYLNINYSNIRDEFSFKYNLIYQDFLNNVFLNSTDNRLNTQIKSKVKHFKETLEYPYYLVYSLYKSCSKANRMELIKEIEQRLDLLNCDFLNIFYLAKGCNLQFAKIYDAAILTFDQGLSHCENDYIVAMLYYNRANVLIKQSNYPVAETYLIKAIDIFADKLCIKRMINCKNSLGILYQLDSHYPSSIQILTELANMPLYTDEPYLLDKIVNNLCLAYIGNEDYDNALITAYRLLNELNKITPATYFYIAYSYYKQDKKEESLEAINLYLNCNNVRKFDFHHELMILIQLIYISEYTAINHQIKIVYKLVKKQAFIGMQRLLIKLIADFYQKNNKYKKAVQYYEELQVLMK